MANLLVRSQGTQGMATGLAETLWSEFVLQQEEAEKAKTWLDGDNPRPSLPSNQLAEYKELQDASPTNWAKLAISIMAQNLYVEGFERGDLPPNIDKPPTGEAWAKLWQPNRMDSRQIAVHRAALGYGVAYVIAEDAEQPLTREKHCRLRGMSPLSAVATWRDPANDEFPEYGLELLDEWEIGMSTRRYRIKVWDSEEWHILEYQASTDEARRDGRRGDWEYVDSKTHATGVVPWVRFANDLDLDGNVTGEVVPFIPMLSRIDQDTFDRLIVQRFGSWKIRTIAGMKEPDTEEGKRQLARILRINDLLVSDNPETRFGTLEATELQGFISARDADIRDLAAVLQIPPHHLLGMSPNVSAEGLVEAQRGLMQKISERQHLFGESWELVLRLGAHKLNLRDEAADYAAQVRWEDTEGRSLAQVADALGKLANMVDVPVEMLWGHYLPGWTSQDTERAKQILEQKKLDEMLEAALEAGAGDFKGGAAKGALLDDEEVRRLNRMRGGYGPDWDADGKPN